MVCSECVYTQWVGTGIFFVVFFCSASNGLLRFVTFDTIQDNGGKLKKRNFWSRGLSFSGEFLAICEVRT